MTAQEYLEKRQRLYHQYNYLVEILLTRRDLLTGMEASVDISRYTHELVTNVGDRVLKDELKEVGERVKADAIAYLAGTRPEVGWVLRAHNAFLGNLPDMVSIKNLDIAVGELETASFNGSAIPVPGLENSWIIALKQGISVLVYEVARAIAGTFNAEIGKSLGTEALTSQQAGRILHQRLNYYVHLDVPYGDEYNVSYEQIALASGVTTMAERFVYAHEMSHIFLGHLDNASLQALPGDWSQAKQTIQRPDQEYEADLSAWQLVTRMFVKSRSDLQMAYAGASLFLQIADLLERAEDLTAIGTHPPASQRLLLLRGEAQRTASEAKVSFEQVATIERAISHGLERALQEAPPLPGSCPFEKILDTASSSRTPDYWSFQNEVFALLSHSAPRKLCQALGRAMGKAEKELRDLGIDINKAPEEGAAPPSQATLHAALQPFNKLKLVDGMLGLYLIPEIGQFIERSRNKYLKEVI